MILASLLALSTFNALVAGVVAGTITTGAHVQTFLGDASNHAGFTELCAGDRSRFRALAEQLPLQDSALALRAAAKFPAAAKVWCEYPAWGTALEADTTALGAVLDRPTVLQRLMRTNGHTLAAVVSGSNLGTLLGASAVRKANWTGAVQGPGSKVRLRTYTASGTWAREGFVFAVAVAVGAGGGGGQQAGGGGGQIKAIVLDLSTLSLITPVVIGTPGTGGASGTTGGSSSFGSVLTAAGGAGAAASTGGAGGSSGTPSGSWGAIGMDFTTPQLFGALNLTGGTGGGSGTNSGGGGGGAGGGTGGGGVSSSAGGGGGGNGENASGATPGGTGGPGGLTGGNGGGDEASLFLGGGGGAGRCTSGGATPNTGGWPGGGGGGGRNSSDGGPGAKGFVAVMGVVA